ncbi:leucine-rich repeat and coiled-coil domain-containing protein 1 [Huso huso]|uniref:Leucine-rich repeat and coiled-coil domain-containing protein 1 n=1 Tax=Huso huso TaxID=61971 RepID=A0ABR1A5F2_HUSHU
MAENKQLDGELCLIDKHITSFSEIPLNEKLKSLNLHCNRISKIEGLGRAWHLRHLDLSSNRITCIEGLGSLASLRTLNLSCNLVTKVEGLHGLGNLIRLNLSYNQISDLSGFLQLHGTSHKLSCIYLHSNCVGSVNHVLQCLMGLQCLTDLTLDKDGKGNPVCMVPGYREITLQSIPQLIALDGMNRYGERVNSVEGSPVDLPGLEDFMEYLVSSDASMNVEKGNAGLPLVTPRIDEVLTKFRQRTDTEIYGATESGKKDSSSSEVEKNNLTSRNLNNELRIKKLEHQITQLFEQTPACSSSTPSTMQKAKRDIDHTSESDCESGKENRRKGSRRSRIPSYRRTTAVTRQRTIKEAKGKKSDGDQAMPSAKTHLISPCQGEESTSNTWSTELDVPRSPSKKASAGPKTKKDPPGTKQTNTNEESTYRAIIEELDQERERRWKAEQAVKILTEQMKGLQTRAIEEKDIQTMAIHTTDRLKELLLKQKAEKSKLQASVHELKENTESLSNELRHARSAEEHQRRALKCLEENMSKIETQRLHQQAAEMKRIQEMELKVAASQREVEIVRVSLRQQKDKVRQLHELLASREQVHRTELESRVTLTGPEFQNALSKEMAATEQRHLQQMKESQEKINIMKQQYMELEDEFRMALTIEATRFKEVKDGFEQITSELTEHKKALAKSQQKEKQSASLIQDLTAMVKEQKARIAELIKSKQGSTSELKSRIRSLEAVVEEDTRRNVQIELLKQDKSKLISQLTAQESVIDGLRAERRIWGQELAHQGASLAQDRGRLEARIDVLTTEMETIKKQNERDINALKIKAKIVDDQTETIRKLKEGLQERDEQIRKLREENLQTQKSFQEQLEYETAPLHELREKVERLTERKEELKQQLEEKETELEGVKKAYSAMNNKWQDKAELLTQLEAQVKHMKDVFDAKEKKLVDEKEKSLQSQKAAVEKLHSLDDAFRRQLDSVQAAHQADLLQLATEKQKQIEAANEKVYQVEEEMRQLLQETASSKKMMEEKIRRLTSVLKEFQ